VTGCSLQSHVDLKEHKSRALAAYRKLQLDVGAYAYEFGPTAAARRFNVGIGFARYHCQKFSDPGFHSGSLGGPRHLRFPEDEGVIVDTLLFRLILLNPVQTSSELAVCCVAVMRLHQATRCVQAAMWDLYGVDVQPRWICRRIDQWGYSFKRVRYKLALKFTAENLRYYGNFIFSRWDIPWLHQKYADEAHFASYGALSPCATCLHALCLQTCADCEASARLAGK
jgi:hypothetical protein